jgi:hypothetical protein
VGVQEVRRDRGGIEQAGEYTLFYGKGNEDHESCSFFFVHKGIISAVKRVQYISDTKLYVKLRDHWCNIIVLNGHAPTKDKIDMKYSLYEKLGSS